WRPKVRLELSSWSLTKQHTKSPTIQQHHPYLQNQPQKRVRRSISPNEGTIQEQLTQEPLSWFCRML
ncbi:hypothetical protein LINPERHAP2_LOCUS6283, partial [Linum perenne]